jgi:hypothetical protein
LRDEQDAFELHGAKLAVVGNGQPWQAAAFREEENIDFPLLTDPEMVAYRAAGLRRSVAGTLSLRSVAGGFKAFAKGHRPSALGGDPWQLGGAFIIAPSGKLLYRYISRRNGDHPEPEEMLRSLDGG